MARGTEGEFSNAVDFLKACGTTNRYRPMIILIKRCYSQVMPVLVKEGGAGQNRSMSR